MKKRRSTLLQQDSKNAADNNDSQFSIAEPSFNPTHQFNSKNSAPAPNFQMKQNPFQLKSTGKESNSKMNAFQMQNNTENLQLQLKKENEIEKSFVGESSTKTKLPSAVQAKMESSFSSDFSSVNIHDNSESAENLGAQAYAQGNDIHFAAGKYHPNSQKGQELLGHELTHVVQQREGRVSTTTQRKGVGINDNASLENEADQSGKKAASGQPTQLKTSNNSLNTSAAPIQGFGFGDALDWAKDKASSAASWAADKATDATSWVADKASGAASWAMDKAKGAASWATDKAKGAASWIGNTAKNVAAGVKNGVKSVGNAVSDGLDWVSNKGSQVWDFIKNKVTSVKDKLTRGAKNLINFVINIGGAVKDKVADFISQIGTSGLQLWQQFKNNLHALSQYFQRIVHPDEEILGEFQAERAQDKLWQMGPSQFVKFYTNTIGQAKSNREKQYIYKALAAGNSISVVTAFSSIIRGRSPEWMRNNLSLTNHDGGKGIKQQWHDSCNATTVQAARGQMDPVYAYVLIQRNKDITSANDSNGMDKNKNMAQEQKDMLEQDYDGSLGKMGGGTAVNRDASGGVGRWADDLLNENTAANGVSYRTLRRGDGHSLTDLIAEIKKGAKRGIPVPIVVGNSPTSYGHYTMVTRMDSSASPNVFFIHDPWEGIMKQFTEDDFKNSTLSLAGWTTLSAVEAVTEE